MDAPRFDLLFKPRQYTPNPEGTQNFIGNIAALSDPSGTLQRKQAELVAKSAAQFKADDLKGQFQETALQLIEKNLGEEMDMYKQNRGFNRLSLSGNQLLEKQRKDKALIANIGTLKQINDDYLQTEDKVGKYVIEGVLSPEDYNAYDTELKTRMAAAGGDPTKIPYPSAVLNNYLMRNTSDKWIKELDAAMKVPIETASKRPTSIQRGSKWFNVVSYDPLNDVLPLIDRIPGARRGLVAMFGDNQDAMKQWLKDRYNVNSDQLAPGQMSNNVNISPSWEKNWKPKYRIVDTPNGKELNFNGSPTSDGIIVTDQIVGDVGEVINPGDLFVPKKTFLRGGERYVAGVTVSKGNIVKANSDGVELSSGATFKPVTVRIDENMKNIIESNYFKPDRDGYPDTSVWGRLQGGIKSSSNTGSSAQQPTSEKTYSMAAALKKYQGFTEAQIRERMSQLGYKEVK